MLGNVIGNVLFKPLAIQAGTGNTRWFEKERVWKRCIRFKRVERHVLRKTLQEWVGMFVYETYEI